MNENKLLNSICNKLNQIICEKENNGIKYFFDERLLSKYVKVFEELNLYAHPRTNVNWEDHLIKILKKNHRITPKIIDEMIKNLNFRKVTFVFPLGGMPISKRVVLNDKVYIDTINVIKSCNESCYLTENERSDLNRFLKLNISAIYLTEISEKENDYFTSKYLQKKAEQIISLLNINRKYIFLGHNRLTYRIINSYDDNSVIFGKNGCEFKIVNNTLQSNFFAFYDGRYDKDQFSIKQPEILT
ncbi:MULTISPECIES: hypothetical protein [Lactobacillus]|uniref:hypothetical protein n=1 Tax=Lactobacillus TaxID=1578 RepID=UPI000CD9213B|nr:MULTISPECIES: hypothetical protein [Lactobacillus]RVU73115.1 hypothetical protein EJK20_09500 [Lactobacillus xujianguonis]